MACALALATAFPAPGLAVPAPQAAGPAAAAGEFLAREFGRLDNAFPSPTSPGNNDAGLMADALLALHRAGVAPAVQAKATAKLRANFFSATIVSAGVLGKDMIVAADQGVNPRQWGKDSAGKDIDLVARLSAAQNSAGAFEDTAASGARTPANVFSQALALIGLRKAGIGNPAGAAALLRQQCPGGGFRLNVPVGDATGQCASDAEVSADTTAMGMWALVEIGGHQPQVAKALGWLRAQQDPVTGAFSADPKNPAQVNTNSSGLAAMALALGGDGKAASRATGWLAAMQVPQSVPVPAMAGAIAKSQTDLDTINRDAKSFWLKPSGSDNLGKQDGLRRATAQALLGLAAAVPGPVPPRPPGNPPHDDAPPGIPVRGAPGPVVGKSGGRPVAAPRTDLVAPEPPAVSTTVLNVPASGPPAPAPSAQPVPVTASTPDRVGQARALESRPASFWTGPEGVAAAVLAGLLFAAGTFWFLVRRKGSRS
ncbi:prenyltransferase/squalene oxidase repeat-containing protein [Amycolatopsis sp. La24]|uniref:prenyltransferase/squalene oxidase repeat-containing protein n=1 Tax=Amycolatopsis sp. La24 TaxID=3028304 RepID=UPI0023B1F4B1|nr:prenyltransferase/squalene oxidase repeat-containing protein [Amycolatopsis sp. La24]